jgi:hypothetical protein
MTGAFLAVEWLNSRLGSLPPETIAGRFSASVSRPVDRCSTVHTLTRPQGFPTVWRALPWGLSCSNRP